VRAELVDDPARLVPHVAAWDELAVAAGRPYCAPAWMLAWWSEMAPAGARMRVGLVHDGEDLIGVGPCWSDPAAGPERLRFLAAPVCSPTGPLAAPGRESEVAHLLATTLAGASPAPRLLVLDGEPDDSPWPELLARAWPADRGVATRIADSVAAPAVSLHGVDDFDDWLAARSRNFRSQVRQGRRRLSEAGATSRQLAEPGAIAAVLPDLARLHHMRREPRGGSTVLDDRNLRMLAVAAEQLAPAGRLWISQVTGQEGTVAAMLFVAAGDTAAYWNGGFDDAWGRSRPGLQALLSAVEESVQRGLDELDLGPGDQHYKGRLADRRRELVSLSLRPRDSRYPLTAAWLAPSDLRARLRRELTDDQKARIKRVLRRPRSPRAPRRALKESRAAMARIDRNLPPAVVLGGWATALPVVRRLGREGVEVYALGVAADPARHSRYARFVDLGPGDGMPERWLEWLVESAPRGAVVLAASDYGAELIAGNRARLVEAGLVPMEMNDEAAQIMLDKQRTAELAESLGIPCPRTLPVDKAEDVAGRLDFPLGLKPVHSHLFHAHFKEKVFRIRDERELTATLERTSRFGLEMVATELIEGPDAGLGGYSAYLDEHSQVMCESTKQKPRQYPPKAGTGTVHVSDWSEEVADLGRRLLTGARVRGHANVEVKRDVRDGQVKLIECNYRFIQATALFQAAGFDIVGFTYNRLTGRPLPSMEYRKGARGIFLAHDLRAFPGYRRIGELTTAAYLRSLARPHHPMLLARDDPAPALALYWSLARNLLRRGRS
jgi:D-aspartate ligase